MLQLFALHLTDSFQKKGAGTDIRDLTHKCLILSHCGLKWISDSPLQSKSLPQFANLNSMTMIRNTIMPKDPSGLRQGCQGNVKCSKHSEMVCKCYHCYCLHRSIPEEFAPFRSASRTSEAARKAMLTTMWWTKPCNLNCDLRDCKLLPDQV